jgi:integrase/recombinase XerD
LLANRLQIISEKISVVSTYNAYIILDNRRKKADNTYPLKLRVVVDRKSFHISLGTSVEEQYWSPQKEQISTRCKKITNLKRLNNFLLKEKSRVLDKLLVLKEDGQLSRLSMQEIKQRISQQESGLLTFQFAEAIIAELKSAKKNGNARVYDTMLRSIKDFRNDKDFPMRQITFAWLKKYEAWYLSKGNTVNGLSVNMRTLRALINRAIKQKVLEAEYYPFNDYKIKQEGTRKRAISMEELKRLKEFVPKTKRQERAQDYFFFSFYLMGASFVDIASLKLSNIVQSRIEYKRKKTGRLHSIPISPPLQALIDKYGREKAKNDYILSVIKSNDSNKQAVEVRDELRRYNRSLKEIGKLCEIEIPLTSYVARHTYATIAKYKGVPTAIISEALGHASEEVTQVYLDSFDSKVLDNYHQLIIE